MTISCEKQFTLTVLATEPLEYWTLDESSANNRAGSINGIDLIGFPTSAWPSVVGKVGNALQYIGILGHYFDTGLKTGLNHNNKSLSFTGWFKFENNPSAGTASTIFTWWFYDSDANLVSQFQLDWSSFLGFNLIANNGLAQFVSNPGLSIGTWYFLHAYFDIATGKVSLELNNVPMGTSTSATTLDPTAVRGQFLVFLTTSTLFRIFDVDELCVRNYLPSEIELANFYNCGAGNTWPVVAPTDAATQTSADGALAYNSLTEETALPDGTMPLVPGYWESDLVILGNSEVAMRLSRPSGVTPLVLEIFPFQSGAARLCRYQKSDDHPSCPEGAYSLVVSNLVSGVAPATLSVP